MVTDGTTARYPPAPAEHPALNRLRVRTFDGFDLFLEFQQLAFQLLLVLFKFRNDVLSGSPMSPFH